MFNRKGLASIISLIFLLLLLLLLVSDYHSGGWRSVAKDSVLVVLIWTWLPIIHALVKRYRVDHGDGWKKLGPSSMHLYLATMPIFLVLNDLFVMAVNQYFFNIPLDLRSISALPLPLVLFILLPCLYGIFFGWVWRLHWDEDGVEWRNIFLQKRWIAWSDIVSVSRLNLLNLIVAKLLDGSRIFVSPSRAGFAELEKDARRMNIVIDHDH
jgi:hypothetical protein